MLQMNEKNYNAGGMNGQGINQQRPNQQVHPLYRYCKVMSIPKMGPIPAIVTVSEGW